MRIPAFVLAVVCVLQVATVAAPAPKFAAKPTVRKDEDKLVIDFAVDAPTDVDVEIVNAKGDVVRHLAAGLLGNNAPAPLKSDSLSQSLVWDGKDDDGKPAAGGPFTARVRLGLGTEFDRFIPSARPLSTPRCIGVGPNGDVYVLSNRDTSGGASMYVLDRHGKYLRTVLPPPPGLTREQTKGLERLKLGDGSEIPLIYEGFMADFAPHLTGIRPQTLVVSKDGTICFASGGSNWASQTVLRHVLAIKPDGSTPSETGFVGPSLGVASRYSIGLRARQQIALSPDGKTIYYASMGSEGKTAQGIHCIGRLGWKDAKPEPFIGKGDEPGNDGTHLNDPRGVSADEKGNLYVADFGNSRVAAFDDAGKFLGAIRVDRPLYACVHPTGRMYVLTDPVEKTRGRGGPFQVIGFDKAIEGKETSRLELTGMQPVLAMDASARPTKLWLTYGPTGVLVPITEADGKLTAGDDVLKGADGPFVHPMFASLDVARERLYVGDMRQKVVRVDLKTDKVLPFLKASEAVTDREGNLYALSGYGTNALLRFDPDGKPANFPGSDSNKITVPYRAGLPHVGVRGLTVAPNGDIYVYEEVLKPQQLHVFGPDGKAKKQSLVRDIPTDSANGVVVDRGGNVYLGVNVHDSKKLYPDELIGQIPDYTWERTYRTNSGWYNRPLHRPPAPPWDQLYLNHYLHQYGNIMKFPPNGGQFWTGTATSQPDGVPADAAEYRTGMLGQSTWCQGALWSYRGFALAGNRMESSGDPTCSCFTSRFCLDDAGRLFVPDAFRFTVTVLDSNGNPLTRIGTFGNIDCGGASGLASGPKIPLAGPNAVVVGGGKAYIIDRKNRRVVVAKLTWATEGVAVVP